MRGLVANLRVEVEPYTPTEDSHRHPVDGWGPAVEVFVFGLGPVASAQAVEGNRAPQTSTMDVYAPVGVATSTKDRWTLPDGTEWLQNGAPLDYSSGPWLPVVTGVVIRLEQIRG